MLDINKPVQTRSGLKYRNLCTDMKGSFPLVGIVTFENGDEGIIENTINGAFSLYSNEGNLDLINVPEKHVRYVWMFKSGRELIKHNPVKKPYLDVVSCKRVELEIGQFDE